MRTKDTGKIFGGACVVYVVMAACGASSDRGASSIEASARATLGDSAALDALTNPVNEAQADPIVDVAQENCVSIAGQTGTYAEHLYAGKTSMQLLAVRAAYHLATPANVGTGAYSLWQVNAFVRDGAAYVQCESTDDYVVFTLAE